jgi:hypothetical protein
MSSLFCPLPWHSLAIRNDGNYRVCCHANVSEARGLLLNEKDEVLNASEDSLEVARNSPTLKNIRSEMLQGKWPSACTRCQREETAGIRSKRIYANEMFNLQGEEEFAKTNTAADGSIDSKEFVLKDLDLRFGNKCNLKCRMCGPSDSSFWYGDYEAIQGREYAAPSTLDWYENPEFWTNLKKDSAKLEHIYVVGGEPLLIDRHYEFLNFLISEKCADQVIIEYNTNLTVLPQKALDLWKHFRQVRIGVSLDAWGPLNNYIRHPSKFSVLEKNIETLDQTGDNIVVWLASTVSILNFYDLSDLIIWKLGKKFKKVNIHRNKPFFNHHVLHKPEFLSTQCLPAQLKAEIQACLPSMKAQFSQRLSDLEISEIDKAHYLEKWDQLYAGLTTHMMGRDLSSYFSEFMSYTNSLDKVRKENIQTVLSQEYYSLLYGSRGGTEGELSGSNL